MGLKGQWLETQEAGMGCDLLFPIPSEVIWNSFNFNQRIAIFVDIRTTLWLQLSHFARYVNPLLVTYLVTVIQCEDATWAPHHEVHILVPGREPY